MQLEKREKTIEKRWMDMENKKDKNEEEKVIEARDKESNILLNLMLEYPGSDREELLILSGMKVEKFDRAMFWIDCLDWDNYYMDGTYYYAINLVSRVR